MVKIEFLVTDVGMGYNDLLFEGELDELKNAIVDEKDILMSFTYRCECDNVMKELLIPNYKIAYFVLLVNAEKKKKNREVKNNVIYVDFNKK